MAAPLLATLRASSKIWNDAIRFPKVLSSRYSMPPVPRKRPTNYEKGSSQIEQWSHQEDDRPDDKYYEKLQMGDPRCRQLMTAAKSRKSRETSGTILLEGHRLINEAIRSGVALKCLFFSGRENLKDIEYDAATGVQVYQLTYKHLQIWSDVSTPPGIIGIFKLPTYKEILSKSDYEERLPLTLVCDNVRDPGNMGALIRSAAAAGCKQVLSLKGTVDAWEPKVLRSAAGGHFQVPVIQNIPWHLLGSYIPQEAHVVLAENHALTKTPTEQQTRTALRNVMEHEQTARQNNAEVLDDHGEAYEELSEDTGQLLSTDVSYQRQNENLASAYRHLPVPVSTYSELDYRRRTPVVLVVGGETEGLSATAHKLAFDRSGDKVYIPMLKSVESLNSAMAASVILFEIRRQIQSSVG